MSVLKSFTSFLILISLAACGRDEKKADFKTELTGNWLILYPDHDLRTRKEREVYGKYQDSLVKLFGLKMVRFDSSGHFLESDSFYTKGSWQVGEDSTVEIRNGGSGFGRLFLKWENLENDTLQLSEYVHLENKPIRIVWHFKKIKDTDDGSYLFQKENNNWRIPPAQPETDEAIRRRLQQMLKYYGEYFRLVQKESAYFIPGRVPLPFFYYRHAIRVKPETNLIFNSFFYDSTQSEKARVMLTELNDRLEKYFPRKTDYVAEYSAYLIFMSEQVEK